MTRYQAIGSATVVVDFRIAKAFFGPSNAAVTGITIAHSMFFASEGYAIIHLEDA